MKLFLCATVPSFRYDKFIVYLKSKRLEESTIEAKIKLVKYLASKFNLWDSDSIRKYIYEAKWDILEKDLDPPVLMLENPLILPKATINSVDNYEANGARLYYPLIVFQCSGVNDETFPKILGRAHS